MAINSEELNELMRDSAKNAVVTTREEFGINLDFSAESVELVDKAISKWIDKYKGKTIEDEMVFTLSNIYGAYIGEVFREIIGGQWIYDETDPDAPHLLLEYGAQTFSFAGTCYQRLINDPDISTLNYFLKAIANNTQ